MRHYKLLADVTSTTFRGIDLYSPGFPHPIFIIFLVRKGLQDRKEITAVYMCLLFGAGARLFFVRFFDAPNRRTAEPPNRRTAVQAIFEPPFRPDGCTVS